MTGEIAQILTNSVGAVAVAVTSFYFMNRMSERFAETVDDISNNYVQAKAKFAEQMQHLTDSIDHLEKRICEQADMLKEMYIQNARLVNRNEKFKTGKKRFKSIS